MKLKRKKYLSLIVSFAMLFSLTISTIADTIDQNNIQNVNIVEDMDVEKDIDIEQDEPIVAKTSIDITAYIYKAESAAVQGELCNVSLKLPSDAVPYSVPLENEYLEQQGYEKKCLADLTWYDSNKFDNPIDIETKSYDDLQINDIYARAVPNNYTLDINKVSGVTSTSQSSVSVDYDGTFSALGGITVSVDSAHEFDGEWKLMKNGIEQQKITATSAVPSNITSGTWTLEPNLIDKYNITYYLNGEEATSSDFNELKSTYSKDEPVTIKSKDIADNHNIDGWFTNNDYYNADPIDIDTNGKEGALTFYGWGYDNEYQLKLKQYVRDAVQASSEGALSEANYYNAVKTAVIYYMNNFNDIGDLKSVDSDLYNKIESLKNSIISYNRKDNDGEDSGLQLVKILDDSGDDVTSDYWFVGIELEPCSADLSSIDSNSIITSFDITFIDWRNDSVYKMPTGFTVQIQLPYGDGKTIDTSRYENIRLRYGLLGDNVLTFTDYEDGNGICSFTIPESSSVVFTGDLKEPINPALGGQDSNGVLSSDSGGTFATGDNIPTLLLILFIVTAVAIIAYVFVLRKKGNKN